MSKSLSDKEFEISPSFGKENKPLRSPSSILADFIHHFDMISKNKNFDPLRYPFIYHFFSYRDFTFWIARCHNGSYELRGQYPDTFNDSRYRQNYCYVTIHAYWKSLFNHPRLSEVSKEFDHVVSDVLSYVYFRSSSYNGFYNV